MTTPPTQLSLGLGADLHHDTNRRRRCRVTRSQPTPVGLQIGIGFTTLPNTETTLTVSAMDNSVAVGERVCSECGSVFVHNGWRSRKCWPCVDGKRMRNTSGYSGRRTRLTDTTKDLSYAIRELTAAQDELRDVVAIAEPGPREASMLIEPASRIGLAAAFLDAILRRMGWERQSRDGEDQNKDGDSPKRKGRKANQTSVH